MTQKNPNCFPDWKDYDRALVEHVIAKSKCKPHYMAKYGNEANFCKDLEGHTNIRNEINAAITKTSEFPPPCSFLERFTFEYDELDLTTNGIDKQGEISNSTKAVSVFKGNAEFVNDETVWVTMYFVEHTYKLIRQVGVI